jgi:hypothetical protein
LNLQELTTFSKDAQLSLKTHICMRKQAVRTISMKAAHRCASKVAATSRLSARVTPVICRRSPTYLAVCRQAQLAQSTLKARRRRRRRRRRDKAGKEEETTIAL